MTTTPDYTQIVLKAQTAAKEIAEANAEAVRAFAELPVPFAVPVAGQLPDPTATLDGIFDYAHKALGIQRGYAKRLAAVAA